jgi:hypothetical protein
VQVGGTEPDLGQRLVDAGFDVPVVADDLERAVVGGTCLDRPQRGDRSTDTEQIGDGCGHVQRERLRQIGDVARRADASRCRRQQPGDQPQERALSGAVGADETGPAGAELAGDAGEGDRAVRPGEADLGQRDCELLGVDMGPRKDFQPMR